MQRKGSLNKTTPQTTRQDWTSKSTVLLMTSRKFVQLQQISSIQSRKEPLSSPNLSEILPQRRSTVRHLLYKWCHLRFCKEKENLHNHQQGKERLLANSYLTLQSPKPSQFYPDVSASKSCKGRYPIEEKTKGNECVGRRETESSHNPSPSFLSKPFLLLQYA